MVFTDRDLEVSTSGGQKYLRGLETLYSGRAGSGPERHSVAPGRAAGSCPVLQEPVFQRMGMLGLVELAWQRLGEAMPRGPLGSSKG